MPKPAMDATISMTPLSWVKICLHGYIAQAIHYLGPLIPQGSGDVLQSFQVEVSEYQSGAPGGQSLCQYLAKPLAAPVTIRV